MLADVDGLRRFIPTPVGQQLEIPLLQFGLRFIPTPVGQI
jgi:hypothetical protein